MENLSTTPPPPPFHHHHQSTPPPPSPLPPRNVTTHSLLNTHYSILTTNTHYQYSLPILTTHHSTPYTLYTHDGQHPPPSRPGNWLAIGWSRPDLFLHAIPQTIRLQTLRVLVHVERLLRAHPCRIVDDAISFQVDRVLLGTYYIRSHSRNLRHLCLSSLQKHTSSLYVWASSYI